MNIRLFVMLCALCAACPGTILAQSISPPEPVQLEQMVVSGEQPGPGMWRVSKGDHVLWIVGTLTPVPKKLTWRAKGIEAIVAQAQEVLGEPAVSVSIKQIGYFTTLFLLPSAMEARKNPDGATLKDVVPADLYKRWLLLRDKYVGEYKIDDEENDIERWRPMFAALRLYSRAISDWGMTTASPVWPTIRDAARKHKVKTTDVAYYPAISEPRAAINQFKASRLADLECLAKTVERIETDLHAMRVRANAWARGDIDALRQAPASDQRAACEEAIINATFMRTLGMRDFAAQVEANWLTAAEAALAKNTVTLASLPITKMVAKDGYLAKLRARGYAVQEPDSVNE
jgi:hypothetical protein